METSGKFKVQPKDDFSYRVLAVVADVMNFDWDNEEKEQCFSGWNGGVYETVEDVRNIRYILAKYGISDVTFGILGEEDRGAGCGGFFAFRYENKEAYMDEVGYSLDDDDWDEDDGEEDEDDDRDEQIREEARAELCVEGSEEVSDEDFFTDIWSVEEFDPAPADKMDKALLEAFAKAGIPVA